MKLSDFFLRTIESRWNWFGCKPWVPARDASFGLARLLAVVVLHGAFGTLVGLLLGLGYLALERNAENPPHFPWWLVAVLTKFCLVQGAVFYGIAAISWNQRAARLRENPAADTRPTQRGSVLLKFTAAFAYVVTFWLVTPLAIYVTVENTRSELNWDRCQASLTAKGERITMRDILGPDIPPGQNAGAAEIFAPLFEYSLDPKRGANGDLGDVWSGRDDSVLWKNSNAVTQLKERLGFPDGRWPKQETASSDKPHTPRVDLEAWAAAYRSLITQPRRNDPYWVAGMQLPPPDSSAARVVLAGMAVVDRDLAAIGVAARLPRSRFPVHWDEGFTTLLSHLGPLKNASQCCLRRCAAHLEAGETNAAFADAENALKIAELLREEPMLISQLVRLAQGILADKTVWQGLATHQWTEAQLAGFQEQLGRMDYLSGMLLAFEGERACGIEGINGLITGSMTGVYPATPFVQNPMRLTMRGMLRDNQVVLAELETQQIQDLRQAVSRVPQTGLAPVATAVGGQTPIPMTPRTILVRMILPALGRVCEKAVRAQTINRMTIVACALERYRIKNGAFPETLDDLAPAFLPATPLDPVNNQPFHYKRTGDGWFEFYSVGLNGRDDGGVVKMEKGKAELDWVWPVPARPEKHLLF